MDFIHFLSSHMLDPQIGGKRLYKSVVAQAVHAERLGYRGVGIPEHHLLNILLIPSPLQMAVKVAAHTEHLLLMTSVCQLPLRDMRIFAGEVVQAQALCDGRLMLGVGKGAFGLRDRTRSACPSSDTKPRFEEDLKMLEALLTRDEVSWNSPRYSFAPLTIMPRPEDPIPLMVAVMNPVGIEAAAKAGYHVQTTPLGGSHQQLIDQVTAFNRGKAAAGRPLDTRLSLQRGVFLVSSDAEAPQDRRTRMDLLQELRQRLRRARHRRPGHHPAAAAQPDAGGTHGQPAALRPRGDDRPPLGLCRTRHRRGADDLQLRAGRAADPRHDEPLRRRGDAAFPHGPESGLTTRIH